MDAQACAPKSGPSDQKPSRSKPHQCQAVSAEEELKRVLPVIAELKKKHPAAVLSVDTYKAT